MNQNPHFQADRPRTPKPPLSPELLQVYEQMINDEGFIEADPGFNLSTKGECLDVVKAGERHLIYAATDDDSAAYQALAEAGIPHFERTGQGDGFVIVDVPYSAKPLSRIAMTERPNGASAGISLGMSDVFQAAKDLLTRVAEVQGGLPKDLSLRQLAFAKENEGDIYLVPPLKINPDVTREEAFEALLEEIKDIAPPANYSKARKVFEE